MRALIAPALLQSFESDASALKASGKTNKLENIAVRGSELTETWQESGEEYATVRFRAHLVDYTTDDNSGAVIEGDKSQPVKFEEEWTFVRDITSYSKSGDWKLTSIQQV